MAVNSKLISKTSDKRVWPRWLGIAIIVGFMVILFGPSIRNLSFNIWIGSLATGLCFALVSLGVYITFRILNFPDLTIDGSFPMGAAISAAMIVAGYNAFVTLPVAFLGGALAGITTALIATRLKIHSLLASILTTTALISINLRIMGRSNIPLLNVDTIFTPLSGKFRELMELWGGEPFLRLSNNLFTIISVGLLVIMVKAIFDWVMRTELGLAMRATGDNPQMIRALGTNTNQMVVLGLAISNGLIGLSGAIFAQYQGFADVNMGVGLIIAGLAAVIVGETLFRPKNIAGATMAVILGMIIYRMAIAAALNINFALPNGDTFRVDATDVKLATALLVLVALWAKHVQKGDK